jgi:hypothetical protein
MDKDGFVNEVYEAVSGDANTNPADFMKTAKITASQNPPI